MVKTIANQISPSQVSGRLATWHRVMEEAGLTYDDLQKPINNPQFRKRLVNFWQSSYFEPTASQKLARAVMGKNIFAIEEAIKHFGVNPTDQQLSVLSEIPFSEAVLKESKNTHILVAVFSLSILEIRSKVIRGIFGLYGPEDKKDWYDEESFAKEHGEISWQLIRKKPIAKKNINNWQGQWPLPKAQVMVYTLIGHYLATGEQLLKYFFVPTSSMLSDGDSVGVGWGKTESLLIGRFRTGEPFYVDADSPELT